jgi:RNA polymerase sigma-70 factor (ECF subfamily)
VTEARHDPEAEIAAVRRALSGEDAAFGGIVDLYAGRIYTHLYRIVRNRQDAEDLTQEVFIKAFRFLGQYDESRPFRSWIFAIATNTAVSALRRQKAQPAWEGERTHHQAVASAPDLQDRVAQSVARLSPQAARLVDLHYREGMSLAEAAAVLGTTEGAAKTMLCRARKQLRQWLTEGE